MAAGEYVSVHSQADTEKAELERERAELQADDKGERRELTAIYVGRGLDPALAKQVADQLMAHDALGRARPRRARHLRDVPRAADPGRPRVGRQLRRRRRHAAAGHGRRPGGRADSLVSGTSLLFLALLGALAAWAGGAGVLEGALRVTFWGALAMAVTAGVGSLFGTTV